MLPHDNMLPADTLPNVPLHATLLQLADEYVAAAYGGNIGDELYHSQLSTAMGCLESVLKNFRLDPRREARVRLRLATLMVNETENQVEAEEILSKGIMLCDRCKLLNLKYGMYHLLARLMATSNPRAAMKRVDQLIGETETASNVVWAYSFRFLRISLGLQYGGRTDGASLMNQLAIVLQMAMKFRHVAVQIMASTLQAIVHLRSGARDGVDMAQRALAAARTFQTHPEMNNLPQLRILIECLSLMCAMSQFNKEQAMQSTVMMQQELESLKEGYFSISLGTAAAGDIDLDSGGILSSINGCTFLKFAWLPVAQLQAMGYLLSGISAMHRDAADTKTVHFLNQGLRLTEYHCGPANQVTNLLRLQLTLAYCTQNDWDQAAKELSQTKADGDDFTKALRLLLQATIKQATGSLKPALELYNAPPLKFSVGEEDGGVRDVQTLGTLNRVLILQRLGLHEEAVGCLSEVEQRCLQHRNRLYFSAFHVAKAYLQPSSAILPRKHILKSAVEAAQTTNNQQLLCVIMNVISQSFFHGIIGDQAMKSVQVSSVLGKRARNRMWMAVADEMYAKTLEMSGRPDKAATLRRDANEQMAAVPATLQSLLENQTF